MALELNKALNDVEVSAIRRFSRLVLDTPGCISLTMGEPGETTPEAIRAVVPTELDAEVTHYAPTVGYRFLREAISDYQCGRGEPYDPDEIIVMNGATEALSCALTGVINPGDEVIIPQPAYILYEYITLLARGVPVHLETAPDDFQIRPEALERVVTDRTKAIVLTSPNNPTGCILDARSLDEVARIAAERDLFVVSDDVYERLVYCDGFETFPHRHPELKDRTLLANSFSKPYAMTGWRMGWLAVDEPLVEPLSLMHQYAVSCLPSFTQRAAAEAFKCDISGMVESYRARRDMTVGRLRSMGLELVEPEGAFYAFPSIEGLGLSSEEFCERAIREAGVGLVPGSAFGAEGYVRVSYSTSDELLTEALDRLEGFVDSLR